MGRSDRGESRTKNSSLLSRLLPFSASKDSRADQVDSRHSKLGGLVAPAACGCQDCAITDNPLLSRSVPACM